ncbi:MATE efflux family protein [Marvinbryantia formatexigens DSM 14469]|uniref:MATE efflux family protein n=1 Tax=Marvinbryantia formatexigens DSM 14469 TaxID=478749 RepID=C6LDM7_9FIRM|nr:MATE family efflux transporter [Marvinbryantia formatexigens]EET61081.1 MATE efflux family protein [Marvinbryantia formatexigens DSM 14469]UWO23671.1 MATE family efflux transporter [Marvinbryantia formatexigens DSM 14469]SDF65489.1 putative efflux protein, MATE family [Marvinbryantia formatexigens]
MTKNMTEGKPLGLIIGFAVPMFLGMLFQQFYSMVDTIIVGQFLGVNPLAGVGATGSLNFLVIGFVTGVCNGFAVPVAQMFGAKKESELRRYVANAVWVTVFLAVVLTAVVVGFCRPLLTLLQTPEDIFEYAYVYIVIIFWGIPCTFLYNILAAVIRSLGDSRTPVVFLALSSLINIVLDIVFIVVFHMNVEGPALATVISQGVSGLICLWYIRRKFPILRMSREEWQPKRNYIWKLCYIGIPMGLQYSVTAIGTLVIQVAINGFGALAVAGVTAAQKINNFLCCPIEALGATMAAYCGQNMGANRIDRIKKGVKDALLCGFAVSIVLLGVVLLCGRQLSLIFLDEPNEQVLDYSYQFLVASAAGYCLLTIVNVVRFTIQGMGFSVFAITSGALEMLARGIAGTVVVAAVGFMGISLANVMAWVFADCFLLPAFAYCIRVTQKKLGGSEPGGRKVWKKRKLQTLLTERGA